MKLYLSLVFALVIPFGALATQNQKQVELTINNPVIGHSDITYIYFDNGLNTNYVANEDSKKNFDTTSGMPFIYSFTSDGVACFSNGYGNFTQSTVVALGIRVADSGTYTLSAVQISNFDGASEILLEDKEYDTLIDLRQGNYNFQISKAQETDSRFYLHLTYPPVLQSVSAGCPGNNGMISITEDSSITWNAVLLFTSGDSLMQSLNNVTGNFDFSGLPGGSYNVAFIYQSNISVKNASVSTQQVTVKIKVASPMVYVKQTVQFFSSGVNASNYDWDFGDSGYITGVANPEYVYYQPGIFTATVRASNEYNCSASDSVVMDVEAATSVTDLPGDKINIIVQQKTITLSVTDYRVGDYIYELYSVSGQLLLSRPFDVPTVSFSVSNLPAGIYVVNIKSLSGNFTKKIFIE